MVPPGFHDFFIGTGQVAGALIGLLFVAIQLSPDKVVGPGAKMEQQLKAATAFSALIDTLFISLAALLPGTNLGEVAAILAVLGLSSTAGLFLLLLRERGRGALRPRQLILPLTLFAVYAIQLYNGVHLARSPRDTSGVNAMALLTMILFAIAIARAWDLLGAPDTSLIASVEKLAERTIRHQEEKSAEKRMASPSDPGNES